MNPFIVFYILFIIVMIAFCIAYTLLRKPSKKVRNKIYKTMLQQYSTKESKNFCNCKPKKVTIEFCHQRTKFVCTNCNKPIS